MHRFLVLVLAAMLVACATPGTDPADATPADPGATPGAGTPGAAATPGADATPGDTAGTATAECEAAFAPLADMEITSLTELGDLAEVDATVTACESVDDWTAAAEENLGVEVRPGTARMLLGMRCQDPAMWNTDLCRDLGAA
jgi:hypothetical protein